ncbi:hypothetical protein ACFL57_03185 [Candidatus Margulisiibacteriota bacterium]
MNKKVLNCDFQGRQIATRNLADYFAGLYHTEVKTSPFYKQLKNHAFETIFIKHLNETNLSETRNTTDSIYLPGTPLSFSTRFLFKEIYDYFISDSISFLSRQTRTTALNRINKEISGLKSDKDLCAFLVFTMIFHMIKDLLTDENLKERINKEQLISVIEELNKYEWVIGIQNMELAGIDPEELFVLLGERTYVLQVTEYEVL